MASQALNGLLAAIERISPLIAEHAATAETIGAFPARSIKRRTMWVSLECSLRRPMAGLSCIRRSAFRHGRRFPVRFRSGVEPGDEPGGRCLLGVAAAQGHC